MSGVKKNKLTITEIFNEINDVFDKEIKTDFKEVNYGDYISYEFKTNSGNTYDLEFHSSFEYCHVDLNNRETLGSVLNINCLEEPIIDCFDIVFTISNIKDKDNDGEFKKEINKFEKIELMGRISFIIRKLINRYNKIKLFVIGNSKRNKMEFYQQIFNNQFSDIFDLYIGETYHHDADRASFFIIRK